MHLDDHHVQILTRLAMTGYGSVPMPRPHVVDDLMTWGLLEQIPESLVRSFSPAPVKWLHVRLTERCWQLLARGECAAPSEAAPAVGQLERTVLAEELESRLAQSAAPSTF